MEPFVVKGPMHVWLQFMHKKKLINSHTVAEMQYRGKQ